MYTVLLANRKDVIDKPVEYQTGREVYKHERKDDRQKHHDFCLGGIAGRRCHLLL